MNQVNEAVLPVKLVWHDDTTVEIDDVTFRLDFTEERYTKASDGSQFMLTKARAMVELLADTFASARTDHVFELGIYKGGSCLLYHKLFNPKKLVAIDYSEPVEALESYIARHALTERISTFYGVDQADRRKLETIIHSEFGDAPIDLVIDDASHLLHETTSSFNTIFPYLRPGGHYVIEDWGWAHWDGRDFQEGGGLFPPEPALSHLIFMILMACASDPGLVDSVRIDHNMAIVSRGRGELGEASFDITRRYHARGRKLLRNDGNTALTVARRWAKSILARFGYRRGTVDR